MGILENLLLEAKRTNAALVLAIAESKITNQLLEVIVAKIQVVINLVAVKPNAPPQYTGPTTINDLIVGVGRQLQGFDADGDVISWSVDPEYAEMVDVSSGGVLTAKVPLGEGGTPAAVVIYLDDGKADPTIK